MSNKGDHFMAADDRSKLKQTFIDLPPDKHIGGWDNLWQAKTTPWDRNGPSLALRDAVTGHTEIFGSSLSGQGRKQRKRALVPGCGRGYDVLLLSSLGYDVFGVDGSQTALDAAEKLKAEAANAKSYAANDATIGKGESTFIVNDFFKDDFLASTNGADFDVIFDYTFLCALPPVLRPAWAKRMSQLLSKDGALICLEWPLGKDPHEGGPPHGLSSQLYVELFRDPGQEVVYDGRGLAQSKGSDTGSGCGLKRVAHYMPERTHEAGKGKDYVSIWSHE